MEVIAILLAIHMIVHVLYYCYWGDEIHRQIPGTSCHFGTAMTMTNVECGG